MTAVERSACFDSDFKRLPQDVADDTIAAVKALLQQPVPGRYRWHPISGFKKPTIFKVDVRPDHSYQLTFCVEGTKATLYRVGTHKSIDRSPR